jgi:NADPH:quinone reductase-like Zn-dependent oxidoreductase
MKALLLPRTGSVDNLEWGEVQEPRASGREALVRVKACAMNHLDVWPHKDARPRELSTPRVLGSDVAGVVEQTGDQVANVKTGDRVMVSPGVSCGTCEACLFGRDNECPEYDLIGVGRPGGYAEFLVVPGANLVPIPDAMSFAEAASVPLVFVTVWNMVVDKARVRPGEWVLVHSAGSGVGIAAIQLARAYGARVIATASTDQKLRKAKDLGAAHGLDYSNDGWDEDVMRLTGGRGVDVVLDSVGTSVFAPSLRCMARGGRMVICGVTSGAEVSNFTIRDLMNKELQVMGSRMGSKGGLLEMMRLFEAGELKPVVHKVFPFEQAADAHREMLNRSNFGKIVLTWE